jgi:hypothetical protein
LSVSSIASAKTRPAKPMVSTISPMVPVRPEPPRLPVDPAPVLMSLKGSGRAFHYPRRGDGGAKEGIMAGGSSKLSEIEALAAELRRKPAAEPEPAADPAGGDAGADHAALLDQLRAALDDSLSDTREFTEAHPVAALSAAFLLGLAVGRLWRSA